MFQSDITQELNAAGLKDTDIVVTLFLVIFIVIDFVTMTNLSLSIDMKATFLYVFYVSLMYCCSD